MAENTLNILKPSYERTADVRGFAASVKGLWTAAA